MPPARAVSNGATSCARRSWPGTVRVVFGKALAAVALILLAAPVGASADTVWTGAGNGVSCGIGTCPTGVLALGLRRSHAARTGAYGGAASRSIRDGNVYFSDQDYRGQADPHRRHHRDRRRQRGRSAPTERNPAATAVRRRRRSSPRPSASTSRPNGDVFIVDYVGSQGPQGAQVGRRHHDDRRQRAERRRRTTCGFARATRARRRRPTARSSRTRRNGPQPATGLVVAANGDGLLRGDGLSFSCAA